MRISDLSSDVCSSDLLRRFANVVRQQKDKFADLIARETGKPLWEAATEVDAVVNKVDISISAYSERTAQRKQEGALGARVAVRHKPHGVLAVLDRKSTRLNSSH